MDFKFKDVCIDEKVKEVERGTAWPALYKLSTEVLVSP